MSSLRWNIFLLVFVILFVTNTHSGTVTLVNGYGAPVPAPTQETINEKTTRGHTTPNDLTSTPDPTVEENCSSGLDGIVTPYRSCHAKVPTDAYPTVREFVSDFPRMTKTVYEHLVPLDSEDAYLNTSLIVLPSQLIPDEWNVTTDAGEQEIKRVYADPMVLTMKQFMTQEECQEMIQLGQRLGYKRSLTTSGVSNTRTSESAYMPESHPLRVQIGRRISQIVGAPPTHIEFGPILRYEIGQQFEAHYDSSQPSTYGRRLTFFVPLGSVEEEDGGQTGFPFLKYYFPPKGGSAIIWRNYEPSAVHEDFDLRMKHGGLPPKRGIKYAVNVWIYNTPYIHYLQRQGTNQTANPADVALLTALPVEANIPLRAPGAINLLTIRSQDVTAPWRVPLDHGIVKVWPAFPSTSFLMLRIPDFLTLDERNKLVQAANQKGWKESLVTSGASSGRTSSSVWIYNTEAQSSVVARIASFLGVPKEHIEATSMTRYEAGQFYHPHFDSQRYNVPDRLMTVHLVLQGELDEDGGELFFPTLSKRFHQIPGTAYIWRNYQPGQVDHDSHSRHGFDVPRTGSIYVMTAWVFPKPIKQRGVAATAAVLSTNIANGTKAPTATTTTETNVATPTTTTNMNSPTTNSATSGQSTGTVAGT